ncbi:hypothetical protein BDZ89DRAFT_1041717 [Hymenopellis radicata]|nr:hypothetical protein BDZ89DRAFT_1041717 [Hymenopellis radicata]
MAVARPWRSVTQEYRAAHPGSLQGGLDVYKSMWIISYKERIYLVNSTPRKTATRSSKATIGRPDTGIFIRDLDLILRQSSDLTPHSPFPTYHHFAATVKLVFTNTQFVHRLSAVSSVNGPTGKLSVGLSQFARS